MDSVKDIFIYLYENRKSSLSMKLWIDLELLLVGSDHLVYHRKINLTIDQMCYRISKCVT